MILHNPISFLLGEKETASALKTCQRERERERVSSLKTCQRENHVSPHSPLKGRVLWGTLGVALMVLVALVVLVACPAANNAGGGSQYRYTCANGTGADATFDASADGLSRCVSCNGGYTLLNEVCLTAYDYVCLNGTPSSLDATVDGLTRCASCNLLYRLDGATDVVGTSCGQVAVGEATRIGRAMQFGVGEGEPFDLAAIGSTLYMVGLETDALHTLDTATGEATQVGSADQFGLSASASTGLAAIGNTLYMVEAVNDALYTLSTTTGVATRESDASVDQFGVGESTPTGLAAISGTLYMVGRGNRILYTLNIDSADTTPDGMAIRVGSTAAGFGGSENQPSGLAAIGNTLYITGGSAFFYTLDTTTGMAAQVGSVAAGFGVGESSPGGLAAIDSTLYMVGQGNDNEALYALRYQ